LLTSDWDVICHSRHDVIYFSLVIQHIHPDDLFQYLSILLRLTKKAVVVGKRANDFYPPGNWQFLEERFGMFPIATYSADRKRAPYETHGDGEEHTINVYDLIKKPIQM
jgi:hypothetical protein